MVGIDFVGMAARNQASRMKNEAEQRRQARQKQFNNLMAGLKERDKFLQDNADVVGAYTPEGSDRRQFLSRPLTRNKDEDALRARGIANLFKLEKRADLLDSEGFKTGKKVFNKDLGVDVDEEISFEGDAVEKYLRGLNRQEQLDAIARNAGALQSATDLNPQKFSAAKLAKINSDVAKVLRASRDYRLNKMAIEGDANGNGRQFPNRGFYGRFVDVPEYEGSWIPDSLSQGLRVMDYDRYKQLQPLVKRRKGIEGNERMVRDLHDRMVSGSQMPVVGPSATQPQRMPVMNTEPQKTVPMKQVPNQPPIPQTTQPPSQHPHQLPNNFNEEIMGGVNRFAGEIGEQAKDWYKNRAGLPPKDEALPAFVNSAVRSMAGVGPGLANLASWPINYFGGEDTAKSMREWAKWADEGLDKNVWDFGDPERQSKLTDVGGVAGTLADIVFGSKVGGLAAKAAGRSQGAGYLAGGYGTSTALGTGDREKYMQENKGRSLTPLEFGGSLAIDALEVLPVYGALTRPAKGPISRAVKAGGSAAAEGSQELTSNTLSNALLGLPLSQGGWESLVYGSATGAGMGALTPGQRLAKRFDTPKGYEPSGAPSTPPIAPAPTNLIEGSSPLGLPAPTDRRFQMPESYPPEPEPGPVITPPLTPEQRMGYGFPKQLPFHPTDSFDLPAMGRGRVNLPPQPPIPPQAPPPTHQVQQYGQPFTTQYPPRPMGGPPPMPLAAQQPIPPQATQPPVQRPVPPKTEPDFDNWPDVKPLHPIQQAKQTPQEPIPPQKSKPPVARAVKQKAPFKATTPPWPARETQKGEALEKLYDMNDRQQMDRLRGDESYIDALKTFTDVTMSEYQRAIVNNAKYIAANKEALEGYDKKSSQWERYNELNAFEFLTAELKELATGQGLMDKDGNRYDPTPSQVKDIVRHYVDGIVSGRSTAEPIILLEHAIESAMASEKKKSDGGGIEQEERISDKEADRQAREAIKTINEYFDDKAQETVKQVFPHLKDGLLIVGRRKNQKLRGKFGLHIGNDGKPSPILIIYRNTQDILTGRATQTLRHELGHAMEHLLDPQTKKLMADYLDKQPFPRRLNEEGYQMKQEEKGAEQKEATGFDILQSEKFAEAFAVRATKKDKSNMPEPIKRFFDKVLELYNNIKDYINRNILKGRMTESEFNRVLDKALSGDLYKEATAKRPIEEILAEPLKRLNSIKHQMVVADLKRDDVLLPFAIDKKLLPRLAAPLNISIAVDESIQGMGGFRLDDRSVVVGREARTPPPHKLDMDREDAQNRIKLFNMATLEYKSWSGEKEISAEGNRFINAMTDIAAGYELTDLSLPERKAYLKWREDNTERAEGFEEVAYGQVRYLREKAEQKLDSLTEDEKMDEVKKIRAGNSPLAFKFRHYEKSQRRKKRGDKLYRVGGYNSIKLNIGPAATITERPGMNPRLQRQHSILQNFDPSLWFHAPWKLTDEGLYPAQIKNFRPLASFGDSPADKKLFDNAMAGIRALSKVGVKSKNDQALIGRVFIKNEKGEYTPKPEYEAVVRSYRGTMIYFLRALRDTGVLPESIYRKYLMRGTWYFPDVASDTAYSPLKAKTGEVLGRLDDIDSLNQYFHTGMNIISHNELNKIVATHSGEYGWTQKIEGEDQLAKRFKELQQKIEKTKDPKAKAKLETRLLKLAERMNTDATKEEQARIDVLTLKANDENLNLSDGERAVLELTRKQLAQSEHSINSTAMKDKIIFHDKGEKFLYHIHDPDMVAFVASVGKQEVDTLIQSGNELRKVTQWFWIKNPVFLSISYFRDVSQNFMQGMGLYGKWKVHKKEGQEKLKARVKDYQLAPLLWLNSHWPKVIRGMARARRPDDPDVLAFRGAGLGQGRLTGIDVVNRQRGIIGRPAWYEVASNKGWFGRSLSFRYHLWAERMQDAALLRAAERGVRDGLTRAEASEVANRLIFDIAKHRFYRSPLNTIAKLSQFMTSGMRGFLATAEKFRTLGSYGISKITRGKYGMAKDSIYRGAARRQAIVTAVSVPTLWTLGYLLAALGTEEEDPAIAARSHNLRLPVPEAMRKTLLQLTGIDLGPDSSVNIPGPWDNNTFWLLPHIQFGRWLHEQDTETAMRVFQLWGYALTNIVPNLAPFSEFYRFGTGYNDFGAPIVPRREQNIPARNRPYRRNMVSHAFAKAIGTTGVDVKPEHITMATEGITLMTGRQFNIFTDFILNKTFDIGAERSLHEANPLYTPKQNKAVKTGVYDFWREIEEQKDQYDRLTDLLQVPGLSPKRKLSILQERQRMINARTPHARALKGKIIRGPYNAINVLLFRAMSTDDVGVIRAIFATPALQEFLPSDARKAGAIASASKSTLRRWLLEASRDFRFNLMNETYRLYGKQK